MNRSSAAAGLVAAMLLAAGLYSAALAHDTGNPGINPTGGPGINPTGGPGINPTGGPGINLGELADPATGLLLHGGPFHDPEAPPQAPPQPAQQPGPPPPSTGRPPESAGGAQPMPPATGPPPAQRHLRPHPSQARWAPGRWRQAPRSWPSHRWSRRPVPHRSPS